MSNEFERGYVSGYQNALAAASQKCREIGTALDFSGNEYVRYADAIKCAAAISSMYVPGDRVDSECIYQYRYLSSKEKGTGDCESHGGWYDCSFEDFEKYSSYGECVTRKISVI